MKQLLPGRRKIPWLALALAIFIFLGQHYGWFNPIQETFSQNQPGLYDVVQVYDGDTVAVDMNGHVEKIRFIGVDTPETHHPDKPVQCGGPAASSYTKNAIGSKPIRLVSDVLSDNRDRYGRLLRYVYLPDGTLLNKKLITTGHGFAYTYFPFTKAGKFEKVENTARQNNIGLWSYCQPIPNEYGGYTSNPL